MPLPVAYLLQSDLLLEVSVGSLAPVKIPRLFGSTVILVNRLRCLVDLFFAGVLDCDVVVAIFLVLIVAIEIRSPGVGIITVVVSLILGVVVILVSVICFAINTLITNWLNRDVRL